MAATTAAPEPPVDAIYRALRSARVDPDLAHEAVEQVRAQAGRNVVDIMESRFAEVESRFAVVESRFDAVETRFDALESAMESRFAVVETRFDALESAMESRFAVVETRFDAVESAMETRFSAVESVMASRFDELKAEIRVLQRVIWPLIGILATTVFGLLYRAVVL